MKWRSLQSVEGPTNDYDEGKGIAFAILPHRAEDGKTYWLEWVPAILFYGMMSKRWIVKRWLGKTEEE